MKSINYLLLLGMALLAGCSQKKEKEVSAADKNIPVQVERATVYTGAVTSSYSGVVEAQKTTALSFAAMGTVTEVLVEEGQAVKKGQLLARVNAGNSQNAYQAALASQQQAEDAYRRMKPMKDNGTLPEIKWVEVETGLAQAKAAVAIAQQSINDCNLYAPASGVIGKKSVQAGMNVVPAMTALELLNIQSVYVKVPVSENEISRFKKGEKAQIAVNAIGKTMTGTIKEIGVMADALSHTYPIKIEVQNTAGEIKPGMVCSVQTTAEDNRSGLLVSGKALQKDAEGSQFVYIEKDGKSEKIAVQTIALIDNKVLIEGDLSRDVNIITSGQQKLNQGTPVKIIK